MIILNIEYFGARLLIYNILIVNQVAYPGFHKNKNLKSTVGTSEKYEPC